MAVTITIEIPEDLAAILGSGGRDLSRAAVEALAVEEYRAWNSPTASFGSCWGSVDWKRMLC